MTVASSAVTREDYLQRERDAEERSELIGGRIVAMAGAPRQHRILTPNLGDAISPWLRDTECRRFDGDVKIWISAFGDYLYPDACVACPPRFVDELSGAIDNPCVVFEVLSPSTEGRDRGAKFERYRTLDSLQEYVLISSDRVMVETFVRQPDGRWLWSARSQIGSCLRIKTLGGELSLSDLYRDWEAPSEKE